MNAAAAPSTPTITDDFNNRTVLGSSWTAPAFASAPFAPTVGAGEFNTNNALGWTSAYYSAQYLGANQEAYATKRTAASIGVGVCLRNPNLPSQTGYSLELSAAGGLWLQKDLNGVNTQIYSNFTSAGTIAIGDRFGLKVSGSTIETWKKTPTGAWQLLRSDVDASAATCSGYLSATGGPNGRLDDFAGTGAAVPSPSATITAPTASSGVLGSNVTLSATANASTVSVQFKMNGANVGAPDTSPPLAQTLASTTSLPNGANALTAVATNAAGVMSTTPVTYVALRNGTVMGINGTAAADTPVISNLGYSVERLEVVPPTPTRALNPAPYVAIAQQVASRRAANVRVLLLVTTTRSNVSAANRASFVARVQDVLAALENYAAGDRANPANNLLLNLVGLELGNEPGISGSGQTQDLPPAEYALTARDLGPVMNQKGVPYLVEGDQYGRSNPRWLHEMYKVASDLPTWVDAWKLHPYGPPKNSSLSTDPINGRRLYNAMYDFELNATQLRDGTAGFASPAGPSWFSVPRAVTEYGVASRQNGATAVTLSPNNYEWRTNLTYSEGGAALLQGTSCLFDFYGARTTTSNRLFAMILYQARDQDPTGSSADREANFGGYRYDGTTAKGGFTTAMQQVRLLPTSTCPTGNTGAGDGIPQ